MKTVEYIKTHHMEALQVYYSVSYAFLCSTMSSTSKTRLIIKVDLKNSKCGLIFVKVDIRKLQ